MALFRKSKKQVEDKKQNVVKRKEEKAAAKANTADSQKLSVEETKKPKSESGSTKEKKKDKGGKKSKEGLNSAKGGFKNRFYARLIFAALINIFAAMFLLITLQKLPSRAKELNNLKQSLFIAKQSVDVDIADFELKANQEKVDKLLALFPDDVGLVDFVQEIEKLKNAGALTNFTFANQIPVRDKTSYLGIPVAIELLGSWEAVGNDMKSLQELPFLLRPISTDLRRMNEEGNIMVKYGGFLYVDESMEKN